MSQHRYRQRSLSNYEHIPTRRTPTRRVSTRRLPPGGSPPGHIRTIGPQPKRRLWPFIVLMLVELLFLLGMVALWRSPYLAMPNYVGPNVEVAQVQISTTKIPHLMHAQVIIFDKDHKPSKPIDCYMLQGNTLTLQADTITFVPWENSLGLHLGYKLTRLVGCHSVTMLTDRDTRFGLNGGEDGFFTMVQGQTWYAELIQAQAYYSQSRPLLANLPVGQTIETFYVFTSSKGLSVMPSKSQPVS